MCFITLSYVNLILLRKDAPQATPVWFLFSRIGAILAQMALLVAGIALLPGVRLGRETLLLEFLPSGVIVVLGRPVGTDVILSVVKHVLNAVFIIHGAVMNELLNTGHSRTV
jgi:hypothetical protein